MPEEFIIYDFETTGLDTTICDVTEIGALHIKGGEIAGVFNVLVKQPGPLPPKITEITGITDAMLEEQGIPQRDAFGVFNEFIGNLSLVGHNIIGYDNLIFTRKMFDLFEVIPPLAGCVDTCGLFKAKQDGIKREDGESLSDWSVRALAQPFKRGSKYNLGFAHASLGCDATGIVAHRAMGDVKMVFDIYKKMTEVV